MLPNIRPFHPSNNVKSIITVPMGCSLCNIMFWLIVDNLRLLSSTS